MTEYPTLDAHAHIDPRRSPAELTDAGVVLAMTLSLEEAGRMVGRNELLIAWGVGCHPRKSYAHDTFNPERFAELAIKSPIIGEIGLDPGYQVPLTRQLSTLRCVLEFATRHPRIVSLHSFNACSMLLDQLERTPVIAPILHWWTGNAAETKRAVELGCYFSVHSAVARRSIFRTQVPPTRLMVESDHGWGDPPAAIPHRVAWAEYLLSASLKIDVKEIRALAWQNFNEVVRLTSTRDLLPPEVAKLLQ